MKKLSQLELEAMRIRREGVEAAGLMNAEGLALIAWPSRVLLEASILAAQHSAEAEKLREKRLAEKLASREAWEERAATRRAAQYVSVEELAQQSRNAWGERAAARRAARYGEAASA